MARFLVVMIGLSLALGNSAQAEPAAGELEFATQVLPLLKARCQACHGLEGKELQGGLRVTSRDALLAGGDSGEAAVVPGKPEESSLWKAVSRDDDSVSAMPPKENDALTAAELAAVKTWISAGAPWPDDERVKELAASVQKAGVAVSTSGGLSEDWTNRRYRLEDLWAYQPLLRPAIPAVAASSPIDAFLAHRQGSLGVAPAPLADRRAWLRRVTFDLIGLPPTSAEVAALVNDPASDEEAAARVVDRLLASPHYGERMARRWLDVVRYADSSGFANDYERGNAWRYRDYVVRSFNHDKPYDQFVREQIAGDEIDPDNPEMLVAVGFLRMGAWELTGMEVPKLARQRYLDDVTDMVGQVFMGHMLQCARCHDHKFDPVPTRDYYRLQAAFATTQVAERRAPFLEFENRAGFDEKSYLDKRRAHLEAELQRINAKEVEGRKAWEAAHPDKKGQKPPRHEFLSPSDLGLERIARKGLERLKWEYDRYEPVALSVYSGPTPQLKAIYAPFRPPAERDGAPDETFVLVGGDPFSPQQPVKPGTLSAAGDQKLPEDVVGRRRALADWLTQPTHPLVARVMVNRIWQAMMGQPLAGNPNNFGATGKKPVNPELLDWLATEFIQRGWSVKSLVREIAISEAYRRASQHPQADELARVDPGGASYAVYPSRRLTAEELRDAMLFASGELNPTLGGIPVRPEIHSDVALQPRQVMGTFAPAWEPSPLPSQRHRRTLYALQLRGVRDPLLEVFNSPTPELSCEARDVSTVAPQAFALFNGTWPRDRALALALRVQRETTTPTEAIERTFQLALARSPTTVEAERCLAHWRQMTAEHAKSKPPVTERPTMLTRQAIEENTGERFEFVEPLFSASDFVPDAEPANVSAATRGLMELCLVLLNTNEFAYLD